MSLQVRPNSTLSNTIASISRYNKGKICRLNCRYVHSQDLLCHTGRLRLIFGRLFPEVEGRWGLIASWQCLGETLRGNYSDGGSTCWARKDYRVLWEEFQTNGCFPNLTVLDQYTVQAPTECSNWSKLLWFRNGLRVATSDKQKEINWMCWVQFTHQDWIKDR